MGGVIGVESIVGKGSTFWFDLMATESPASLHPELESLLAAEPGANAARSLIVLYIEDNPSNMALMKRIAETRQGVQLIGAPQARLGLDLARVHRPDLILLDLHLPDMPGHEVLEQLRRDPDTKAIPVVIVSADATPEQMDRLLSSGAQSYVTKPIPTCGSMLRLLDSALEDGAVALGPHSVLAGLPALSSRPAERRQPAAGSGRPQCENRRRLVRAVNYGSGTLPGVGTGLLSATLSRLSVFLRFSFSRFKRKTAVRQRALAGSSKNSAACPTTGVTHMWYFARRITLWHRGNRPIENARYLIRQLELRFIKMMVQRVVTRYANIEEETESGTDRDYRKETCTS